MRGPDINNFLKYEARSVWLHNEYMSVYVRSSTRVLGGARLKVFDIANVTTTPQGSGVFTDWLSHVEETCPRHGIEAVLIENVLTPQFEQFFVRKGFTPLDYGCGGSLSYYRILKEKA